MAEQWRPDILGPPFEQLTLPLEPDDEGPVDATLVRAVADRPLLAALLGDRRALHDVDVLYVHGWSDYFFQRSLARYWTDRGADFYALDLRKYGRSLRSGQTAGYIADLATYDEVDAPVSGGQAGAENGALTVMCGGDAEPFGRAEKVIASYARACNLLGNPGAGQLAKMVNQICIAGLVQGLSEGLHFAKRAGLDIEKLIATISKGAAQSWQMENRYKTMADGQVRFRLRGRLDAQGSRHLPRRGAQQRRQPPRHRAGRSVLCGSAEDGRQALGYVEPDRAASIARHQRLMKR